MTVQERVQPAEIGRAIVKEAYFEPEYVEREKQRFWPRVWQMTCRVEQLKNTGDYVTYDIGDESVIVIRSGDEIKAFYNVCRHRGRRLTNGCGTAQRLRCPFHGWQWRIDGSNAFVTQREDWGPLLDGKNLDLKPVKCESWGGFVFINFDPDSEPLLNYLGAAAHILAPFELDKMRYRWRKWLVMPCNWKIALEAFNEGYHVSVTHSQLARFGGMPHHVSSTHGPHGTFGGLDSGSGTFGGTAAVAKEFDIRQNLKDLYIYLKGALDSNMTDTIMEAAAQLVERVPSDTPPAEVVQQLMIMSVQNDAARGVQWPQITAEEYSSAGIDWHIFPNMILLPMATNCLGYRARPNGDDPNTCIFEVYQLERFPEGAEPIVENLQNNDIYDAAFWGEILLQDFQQMEGTHRGIKSKSFQAPVLNPLQEQPIANFHRAYHQLVEKA